MIIRKRQVIILSSIFALLAIPFTVMQFSSEVNWSLFDFMVVGGLLLALGFAIDLAIRKTKTINKRYLVITAIVVLFLLVWAELAVGVFGTPLAGS
ncbi:hypothetical protein [Flagellimonas oceanensis]|uniref:hypothetical protein n=1 Tax=Flagellimonas oceanensis TaxID=2499163 RepID=UPI000F8D8F81|nr:hypothetical protein [Allomuricauda oceanensis]|tara:strand:+ start:17487 stop:17774 length:288 start_codon:yes stop_codon:yes gene_type:complete